MNFDNMEIPKSKVYVKTDENSRIIRCEGGYTTSENLEDWTYIGEGTGDKYNLCQSHYFNGGLYDVDGIPRYKLMDGVPILRSDAEIEADRTALPASEAIPSVKELAEENKRLKAQIAANVDRQEFLEDCIAEMASQVYSV
jgi:hypothetical protein